MISQTGRKIDLLLFFFPTEKLVPLCWGSGAVKVQPLLSRSCCFPQMCPVESGDLNLPVAAASATEKFRLKLPRAALLLLIILPDCRVDLGFASSCKMYTEQVDQHIPVWCCSWFSPQKSEDTFPLVVPVGFGLGFLFYIISYWNFQG